MAAWTGIRHEREGYMSHRAAISRQLDTWKRMSHRCQGRGRNSRTDTLQKVRNNMTNINVGVRYETVVFTIGLMGANKGRWAKRK